MALNEDEKEAEEEEAGGDVRRVERVGAVEEVEMGRTIELGGRTGGGGGGGGTEILGAPPAVV